MHIQIDSVEMISAIEAKDGECDSIDFTHVLDLIEPAKTLETLRFLASKLCYRGTLTLSVTDFDLVCDQYKAGTGDPESMLCRDGMNRSIFNRGKLMDTLNMAGFEIIGGTDGRLGWTDAQGRICVTATKRERRMPELPMKDIHALMSLPRIGWTDSFGQILETAAQLQLKFTKSTGVFWGQCLERLMASVCESAEPPKYILTIDYDSIFDSRDVIRLWQIMEDNPDIAALCPMQIGRDRDAVLINLISKDGGHVHKVTSETFYAETVEIKNGHFGLTLIRSSALKDLPHPWFIGVPNKEGRWDEGRTDDDIYFWHKLRAAGKRICATPKVRLGHLQLMITWPKDDLSCVHQYLNKFHEEGRPKECMTY